MKGAKKKWSRAAVGPGGHSACSGQGGARQQGQRGKKGGEKTDTHW